MRSGVCWLGFLGARWSSEGEAASTRPLAADADLARPPPLAIHASSRVDCLIHSCRALVPRRFSLVPHGSPADSLDSRVAAPSSPAPRFPSTALRLRRIRRCQSSSGATAHTQAGSLRQSGIPGVHLRVAPSPASSHPPLRRCGQVCRRPSTRLHREAVVQEQRGRGELSRRSPLAGPPGQRRVCTCSRAPCSVSDVSLARWD